MNAQTNELVTLAAAALAAGAKVTKVEAKKPAKAKATVVQTKGQGKAKVIAPVTAVGPMPKCAAPRIQVAKPQHKMLQRIAHIGKHPGHALRIKRWHMYKVGMSLAQCKATAGLDHLDVLFYVQHNLMTLRPATAKEIAADTAPWSAPVAPPVPVEAKAKAPAKPAKAKATPAPAPQAVAPSPAPAATPARA